MLPPCKLLLGYMRSWCLEWGLYRDLDSRIEQEYPVEVSSGSFSFVRVHVGEVGHEVWTSRLQGQVDNAPVSLCLEEYGVFYPVWRDILWQVGYHEGFASGLTAMEASLVHPRSMVSVTSIRHEPRRAISMRPVEIGRHLPVPLMLSPHVPSWVGGMILPGPSLAHVRPFISFSAEPPEARRRSAVPSEVIRVIAWTGDHLLGNEAMHRHASGVMMPPASIETSSSPIPSEAVPSSSELPAEIFSRVVDRWRIAGLDLLHRAVLLHHAGRRTRPPHRVLLHLRHVVCVKLQPWLRLSETYGLAGSLGLASLGILPELQLLTPSVLHLPLFVALFMLPFLSPRFMDLRGRTVCCGVL
mmetsp:Transcript_20833/g.69526  ORF Transcript_20833/g.69526 Transcript_20833/m.69526 type:complete len:356 (-) Transcript_20833:160-1227(-)